MKSIKLLTTVVITLLSVFASYAQTSEKEEITVSGNCGMCEQRIENAAQVNGVLKADWDKETKVLTLVYNPAVVSSDEVQTKIAAAGHDTEKIPADEKAYNNLPACCKYERNLKQIHSGSGK